VYKRQIYKQQQANMVIDGAQEPRYWEGVQVRPCSRQHRRSSRVFYRTAVCHTVFGCCRSRSLAPTLTPTLFVSCCLACAAG
jgi:hypothetical protein